MDSFAAGLGIRSRAPVVARWRTSGGTAITRREVVVNFSPVFSFTGMPSLFPMFVPSAVSLVVIARVVVVGGAAAAMT